MAPSNTFFEQIPVETVKRIAKEFPEEIAIASDSDNTKSQTPEVGPTCESWREVAQKVQCEPDPKKMTELVEQLIVMLDQERPCKRVPGKPDAENRSD